MSGDDKNRDDEQETEKTDGGKPRSTAATTKPAVIADEGTSTVTAFPTASERAARQRQSRRSKAQGKTLCGRGFHKWVDDARQQFDVKSGRLVTSQRCERCGKRRNRLA